MRVAKTLTLLVAFFLILSAACKTKPKSGRTPAVEPAPKTTAPKTTAPETATPKTTAPKTTAPETAAPKTTAPKTAAPKTAAAKVTILRVWNDDGKPAAMPRSCRHVASAHGKGKTDAEARRSFEADALRQGGNAATLLSGRMDRTPSGAITSIQHAGLVYQCAPKELAAYRLEHSQ